MRFYRLLFFTLFFISAISVFASSGKIAGTVIDEETGEGLPFANVFINGTTMGSAADLEGNFTILNVQPGVYTVTASIVGYQKQSITDVRVRTDFTTRLEFELSSGSIEMEAVIVQGERNPLITSDKTNPTVSINAETIDELPVTEISQLIRLQAGVVQGNDGKLHFRGGYSNEVAYTLNGVSLNDPYGNSSSIGLATNAVQEVSVSVGTFSAEYGNALSGIVNYVTREGGSDYTFSLRGYGGDYITPRDELFFNIDDINPLNRKRMEATFGGPIPGLKDVSIFVSGVYEDFGGSLYGERLYNMTDSYLELGSFPQEDPRFGSSSGPYYFNPYNSDTTVAVGEPTGDGEIVALNQREDINIQGNISYRITPTLKVKYEVVYEEAESQGGGSYSTFQTRFLPDARGTTYSDAMYHALDFTHTVGQNLFYTIKGSFSNNKGKFYQFENPLDKRYLPSNIYSRTIGNTAFLTGGTDNLRFNRETKAYGVKGDLTAQLFKTHEIKLGFEGRIFELDVESYNVQVGKVDPTADDGYAALTTADLFNPNTQYFRRVPVDTSLYTNYTRKPKSFSAYFRDKIELAKSLILNAGLRYEYFDPNASYNPNISGEFKKDLQGTLTKGLEEAEVRHLFSPRISVAYPITDQGIIRFSYGHFYQNGSLSSLYRNPHFFARLGSRPTFGNPNVKPQKSVQYELGLQQGLTEDLRLEISGYYKDVTNYIQNQTVFTTNGKEFRILTNLAYSNVKGVTISLFKRRSQNSLFQSSLDYTFQIAEGNRTEPEAEIFFSESTGKLTETFLVPLDFDRQHIINATINLIEPNDWTLGLTGYFQTGTPYTPSVSFENRAVTFEQNSATRPTNWNVNLKFEKFFQLGSFDYSVFLQINNLFDTENEIYIYSSSGRALSAVEETTLASQFNNIRNRIEQREEAGLFSESVIDNYYARPQNVSSPREVRLGFSIIFD
jgi:outer membrane receptor protein involved in Fe transport